MAVDYCLSCKEPTALALSPHWYFYKSQKLQKSTLFQDPFLDKSIHPNTDMADSGQYKNEAYPSKVFRIVSVLFQVTCPKAVQTELISCDCYIKFQSMILFCDSPMPNLI
jgi:hypothetical protein